ncbi:MAG: anti-sigma F factor [Firmicutes bacterium]|nr:anti-sigma F factor [Bacillota bacterium]
MEPRDDVSNQVRLEFPNLPQNVGFARVAMAVFAAQLDFTLDELEDIKVAVSEAVSNAVIHAYEQARGTVVVEGCIREGRLEVAVLDRGKGIENIQLACQPAFTTQPEERMGLGLVFVKEFMDTVNIESEPGQGTRIEMSKIPQNTSPCPGSEGGRGGS